MRICHFCASVGMGRGDVYVDLVNRMAVRCPEITLALLVPADARGLDRVDPRVEILKYRAGNGRLNPLLWREVGKLICSFRPDLVHTHFAKATAIYRRVRPWVKIPYVATKHNPRRGAVYNKVPCAIAVSEAVRASISHGRVRVIYNGLLPEAVRPTVQSRQDGPMELLNVGRLEPVKGQDRLIRALAASGADWKLTILGEGPFRPELERLVATLGVEGRVSLPGYQADVPEAMASCDAFIQSSRSEGFGIALLEAMHYAPLALSSPVGLAAEIFPAWLQWNPDDPATLSPLFTEYASLAKRFQAWSHGITPRFHLDQCIREHIDCYREILDLP